MRKIIIIFLFVLFLFSVPCNCSYAVWLQLTEEQTKQAIAYGKANKDMNMFEFLSEWVVAGEKGLERIGINTKFSIIALAAREAALQNREVTPEEIKEKTADVDGILSFQAVLYGPSAEFARNLAPVLEYKDKYIIPVRKQNAKRAMPRGWWPGKPRLYNAICVYDFPDYFVDPSRIVTLVIISHFEPDRRFVFNLGLMR